MIRVIDSYLGVQGSDEVPLTEVFGSNPLQLFHDVPNGNIDHWFVGGPCLLVAVIWCWCFPLGVCLRHVYWRLVLYLQGRNLLRTETLPFGIFLSVQLRFLIWIEVVLCHCLSYLIHLLVFQFEYLYMVVEVEDIGANRSWL